MARKIILHVEDSPDTVGIVKLILEKEGYIVKAVGDGESGIRALKRVKPDLLLVDIMLPGMNGWEFVRRARELTGGKTPAIIMLSALEISAEHRKKLDVEGVSDYITKPFTVKALVKTVKKNLKASVGKKTKRKGKNGRKVKEKSRRREKIAGRRRKKTRK